MPGPAITLHSGRYVLWRVAAALAKQQLGRKIHTSKIREAAVSQGVPTESVSAYITMISKSGHIKRTAPGVYELKKLPTDHNGTVLEPLDLSQPPREKDGALLKQTVVVRTEDGKFVGGTVPSGEFKDLLLRRCQAKGCKAEFRTILVSDEMCAKHKGRTAE